MLLLRLSITPMVSEKAYGKAAPYIRGALSSNKEFISEK